MRGADVMQASLFTTVHLETFVPKGHPLRVIRALMDEALRELNGLFAMVSSVLHCLTITRFR